MYSTSEKALIFLQLLLDFKVDPAHRFLTVLTRFVVFATNLFLALLPDRPHSTTFLCAGSHLSRPPKNSAAGLYHFRITTVM